jgi:endoglucanase
MICIQKIPKKFYFPTHRMRTYILGLTVFLNWNLSTAQLPLLQAEGTYFVTSGTKEKIVLKGLVVTNHCWGFWEKPFSDSLQKINKDPLIKAREMKPFVFTPDDAARLSELRGNVVRYCFNDDLFREDNPKRFVNIAVMRNHISQLAQKGIYTVLCMLMSPGLNVQNDIYERNKPGQQRLKSIFENDSVFRLWRNTWQFVAGKLVDMDAVAGYELINEPRRPALADVNEQKLLKIYSDDIDTIRAVDNRHIIFVPEFNSREANPGEEYWNELLKRKVIDKGEQGIIWDNSWLHLPKGISNLAYIAHCYYPFEFTTSGTSNTFDADELRKKVQNQVDWVYNITNSPLFFSEYGVDYYQILKGQEAKRTAWLKIIHETFDTNHLSSTFFQYKELITPWVSLEQCFGIWFQYYDQGNIKSVSEGKVVYSDSSIKADAVQSKIDLILNRYFIQNGAFQNISSADNTSLINELKRYFSTHLFKN